MKYLPKNVYRMQNVPLFIKWPRLHIHPCAMNMEMHTKIWLTDTFLYNVLMCNGADKHKQNNVFIKCLSQPVLNAANQARTVSFLFSLAPEVERCLSIHKWMLPARFACHTSETETPLVKAFKDEWIRLPGLAALPQSISETPFVKEDHLVIRIESAWAPRSPCSHSGWDSSLWNACIEKAKVPLIWILWMCSHQCSCKSLRCTSERWGQSWANSGTWAHQSQQPWSRLFWWPVFPFLTSWNSLLWWQVHLLYCQDFVHFGYWLLSWSGWQRPWKISTIFGPAFGARLACPGCLDTLDPNHRFQALPETDWSTLPLLSWR